MIIIKIICLFLIFFISTQIGFLKANTYKKRLVSLNKIITSLNLFKTKIKYTNETITEIFNQISKIIYDGKDNIFINSIINLEKDKLFSKWNNSLLKEKQLKEEDREILKIFGKNLGKLDKNGQTNQIEEALVLLKKQAEAAEIDKQKNEKLYKTLGIIMGTTIIIILI